MTLYRRRLQGGITDTNRYYYMPLYNNINAIYVAIAASKINLPTQYFQAHFKQASTSKYKLRRSRMQPAS